jgi:hypothetical protein
VNLIFVKCRTVAVYPLTENWEKLQFQKVLIERLADTLVVLSRSYFNETHIMKLMFRLTFTVPADGYKVDYTLTTPSLFEYYKQNTRVT